MSALTYLAHVQSTLASSIGFALSILVSYTLQRFWVFADAQSDYRSSIKFLTVTAMAFCINVGVMWTGTEVFNIEPIIPQAVALVLIPVFNFVVNRAWTFRKL
jgi:putative flippase GtrA